MCAVTVIDAWPMVFSSSRRSAPARRAPRRRRCVEDRADVASGGRPLHEDRHSHGARAPYSITAVSGRVRAPGGRAVLRYAAFKEATAGHLLSADPHEMIPPTLDPRLQEGSP